jgi:hypothetical protein
VTLAHVAGSNGRFCFPEHDYEVANRHRHRDSACHGDRSPRRRRRQRRKPSRSRFGRAYRDRRSAYNTRRTTAATSASSAGRYRALSVASRLRTDQNGYTGPRNTSSRRQTTSRKRRRESRTPRKRSASSSRTLRPARFGTGRSKFRAVSSMSPDVLSKKQTASSPNSCSAWLIHSPRSEKAWRSTGIAVTKSRVKTFASSALSVVLRPASLA